MTGHWADVIRVLLMSQAGLTLGLLAVILHSYARVWIESRPRSGLLPAHVTLISLAMSLFVLHGTFVLAEGLGDPVTWQVPWLLVALIVSDAAIVLVMIYERRKLRHLRLHPHPRRRVDDI